MSRSISRMGRLRQVESLLFRHPQGLRIVEIAAACEVDRRTIYRDIDLLSEAGVPIWQHNGRYGIIRDQYLATVRLKFSEAMALYIAARLLARHADEHNPHIVAALNKLATAFPDPLTDYISRTAQAVQKRPVNPTFVAVLETISLCWAEKHKVHLWYRSPRSGALRQHDFSPYLIEPSSAGGLYVIGYDDWARGIRTFKLERLERAERSEETYDIPKEFDPSGYLADAWGIMGGETPTWIVLRFSPVVSTYVRERIWHPLQILQTLDDGSVLLRLRIADPREIRPWIRSWGAEVEVLEPETLRRELAEEASRTAALYADKS